MNTRKKTAFGILGATATAALAFGAATPALADESAEVGVSASSSTFSHYDYWTQHHIALTGGDISNESPVVVAPEVHTGDVASGNSVGNGNLSGNQVNGNHVGSGNVIGSGNDTAIGSGNTTGITGVEGVDIDASDTFDSTVGDVTADVSDLLDDIDVTLDTMFED